MYKKFTLLSILIYWLLLFFILFPFWLKKTFGNLSLDQFFLHLLLFYNGSIKGDSYTVKSFLQWFAIWPLCISIFYLYLKNFFKLHIFKYDLILFIIFIFYSININTFFFSKNNTNFKENFFIEENYTKLEIINNPSNQKNLIIIYVESLENQFSNEVVFGENLLNEFSDQKLIGSSIKNLKQINGYGFTINALFSTQCGIPAKSILSYNGFNLRNLDTSLPNLICLSDITKKYSYKNIYITNDIINSSGVKPFLIKHNFHTIIGADEIIKKHKYSPMNSAFKKKIHDDALFEVALKEVQLNKQKDPIFLTIFTIDTHGPVGFPNPNCKFNYKNEDNLGSIKKSVKCSVLAVSNFIKEIKDIKEKNFEIIILGDHLFPNFDNNFFKSERTIFNKFITEKKINFNREDSNLMDFFPTILSLLDFQLKNNRAGLGFSLIGSINNKEIYYKNFINNIEDNLTGISKKYNYFWGIY